MLAFHRVLTRDSVGLDDMDHMTGGVERKFPVWLATNDFLERFDQVSTAARSSRDSLASGGLL
jgi:hypothetical protein